MADDQSPFRIINRHMIRELWRMRHKLSFKERVKLIGAFLAMIVLMTLSKGCDLILWALRADKRQRGVDSLDDKLARNPRDAAALFERALARMNERDWEPALDDLDAALRYGYRKPDLYLYRARCQAWLGLDEDALADYDRFLKQHPGHGEAHFDRANSLNRLGEYELAIAQYNKAWSLGANFASLFLQRAHAWKSLNEVDKALADLRESLHDSHGSLPGADWYHSRGELFHEFEQHLLAHDDYTEAIRLHSNNANYYFARAKLLIDMDRPEQAEPDLDRMEQINLEVNDMADKILLFPLVQEHFSEAPIEKIDVTVRKWPLRAAADLQCAFDRLDAAGLKIKHFFATQHCSSPVEQFTDIYIRDRHNPVIAVPPQYLEIDIGEAEPIRALRHGMWMLHAGKQPLLVLLNPGYDEIVVQVAGHQGPEGLKAAHQFFKHIEDTIARSACYRGKILSLEQREMYSGQGLGIMVHKLRHVAREDVILPPRTLEMLDRNVMQFIAQRPKLAALGMSIKKGLLFHGPPGTGKTHTIHYLARSLPQHTTFLISAEQVCNLGEYMTLARMLQPSMVVIEDVDLIARERSDMRSAGEEVMLNKLLNEMDGLRADAEILFILTTNRPSALEDALASRPGRVDQAIEIPLPDEAGRAKLLRLYSQGIAMNDEVIRFAVERTDKVSASFIKELMRRAAQFALVNHTEGELRVESKNIENALEELLVQGGPLNRKLLGAVAKYFG